MKEYDIVSHIQVMDWEELSQSDRELLTAARKATETSYSPYSGFRVGAAARLANGVIFHGSNQENASYPLSLCAERTCLFAANAHYPEQAVMELAIAARKGDVWTDSPIPPCGACRQVILEVEDRYQQPVRILLYGTSGTHIVSSIKDILPMQFLGSSMEEGA